ncbi:hypothetical protein LCGC14_0355530 [marine sediment metagenome]|uniref:Uncharacterized protein n=1 Tax=marine sediment metagenome TaxID=412755 RepID=A0A0F9WHW0_9ZZZZ
MTSEPDKPSVDMKTIVRAIDYRMDVRDSLLQRAVRDGYAEWVKSCVLTDKGKSLLEDKPHG